MADTSTDAAVKRWLEFYGEINRDNLCKFLGITYRGWNSNTGTRNRLRGHLEEAVKEDQKGELLCSGILENHKYLTK